MVSSPSYIIYGCGGHARSVADVILAQDKQALLTFVDKAAQPGEKIFGFDVVRHVDQGQAAGALYFLAIGNDSRREALSTSLEVNTFTKVIAVDAYVGREAEISQGVFVGHGAYIGPQAKIGEHAIINTRATVEHEVEIGSYSQITPGVIIGGRTRLGKRVFIGLRATIIDGLEICSGAVIGAGAVVISNIEEPGTYVGIPARRTGV